MRTLHEVRTALWAVGSGRRRSQPCRGGGGDFTQRTPSRGQRRGIFTRAGPSVGDGTLPRADQRKRLREASSRRPQISLPPSPLASPEPSFSPPSPVRLLPLRRWRPAPDPAPSSLTSLCPPKVSSPSSLSLPPSSPALCLSLPSRPSPLLRSSRPPISLSPRDPLSLPPCASGVLSLPLPELLLSPLQSLPAPSPSACSRSGAVVPHLSPPSQSLVAVVPLSSPIFPSSLSLSPLSSLSSPPVLPPSYLPETLSLCLPAPPASSLSHCRSPSLSLSHRPCAISHSRYPSLSKRCAIRLLFWKRPRFHQGIFFSLLISISSSPPRSNGPARCAYLVRGTSPRIADLRLSLPSSLRPLTLPISHGLITDLILHDAGKEILVDEFVEAVRIEFERSAKRTLGTRRKISWD